MYKATIAVDLDGVVCEEGNTFDRSIQEPFPGVVEKINKLYKAGYKIQFFSARTWPEYEYTLAWLDKYCFMFHDLILGKPPASFIVDDRSVKSLDELFEKLGLSE